MNKIKITKKILYQKYIVESKTNSEVAAFFGCSKTTIIRNLSKFNIKKSLEEIGKNISSSKISTNYKLINSLYFEENLTKKQISNKIGISKNSIASIISKSGKQKTKEQLKAVSIKVNKGKDFFLKEYIENNRSTKERGYADEAGLVKIYDAGQRLYIKNYV